VVLVQPRVIDTPLYESAASLPYDQALQPHHATWPARFGFPERLLKAAASADSAGAVGAIASLRSLATGILRLHGDRNIARRAANAAQNIPSAPGRNRPPTTYRARITAGVCAPAVTDFATVRNRSAHTTEDAQPRSQTVMTYSEPSPADLESVLEAAPQEFESPILRCLRLPVDHVVQHQSTVNDPG